MHPTAMSNCKSFFDSYSGSFESSSIVRVVEIGSLDVNGGLRGAAPDNFEYIGFDFVEGKGVDIVLSDPYTLPLDSNSTDIVITSSCFEHSEMFWLVFLEIMRVLKPKGILYINVPSNGEFHRFPVDCWRFYPDSGRALVSWAKRNSINAALLESYTSLQAKDKWNDFVAVFLKDVRYVSDFSKRILDNKRDITNGLIYGDDEFINKSIETEDQIHSSIIQITKRYLRKVT